MPQCVGRHLPLAGMRTCRLVCKRWAAALGESVTAIGVPADLLRNKVLSDAQDARAGSGAGGGDGSQEASSSEDEGGEPATGVGGVDQSWALGDEPMSAQTRAGMRRLRRLSRQLARAFPRAHTCVIHIDIG